MSAATLLMFAAALLVAAGSPGPSIVALVARVLTGGARDAIPFAAAMLVGEVFWLSFAVFGLVTLAQSFHVAFLAVKWIGFVYLLYLARKMWASPVDLAASGPSRLDSPSRTFLTGMAVTLGNPKIMMFYLAIFPTIIDPASVTWVGWAELVVAMLAVMSVVQIGWIAAATRARRLLRNAAAMRVVNRLGAGLVAGAAGVMATRA